MYKNIGTFCVKATQIETQKIFITPKDLSCPFQAKPCYMSNYILIFITPLNSSPLFLREGYSLRILFIIAQRQLDIIREKGFWFLHKRRKMKKTKEEKQRKKTLQEIECFKKHQINDFFEKSNRMCSQDSLPKIWIETDKINSFNGCCCNLF